jgi:MFS family permease
MTKNCFILLLSKEFAVLIPLITTTAFSIAFENAAVVIIYISTMSDQKTWNDTKKQQVGLFALAVLGAGAFIGSFVTGYIIDKKGLRNSFKFTIIFSIINYTLWLVYLGYYKYSILTYFTAFTWGFYDSAMNTILNTILGFTFKESLPSFTMYWSLFTLLSFVFIMVESVFTKKVQYIIWVGVFGALTLIAFGILIILKVDIKDESA